MFNRFNPNNLVISQSDVDRLKREFQELKEENSQLKNKVQSLSSNAAWKLVEEYQVEITDLKLKYNETIGKVASLNKTLTTERATASLVLKKLQEVISMFEDTTQRKALSRSLEHVNIFDIIG